MTLELTNVINDPNDVNSVSNVDGSLTISPTTGAVIASINVGNTNTWTISQIFGAGLSIGSNQKIDVTGTADMITHVSVSNTMLLGGSFAIIQANDLFTAAQGLTVNGADSNLTTTVNIGGGVGVSLDATDGILTMAGLKAAGNNENLIIDFETIANEVEISTGTGVTALSLNFGNVDVKTLRGVTDSDTQIRIGDPVGDIMLFKVGNVDLFRITQDTQSVSLFNVDSVDMDFQVNADTKRGLFVEGSSGDVVIGDTTGVSFSSASGVLTIAGIGNTNNENLIIDFETVSNQVGLSSGTGVTILDLDFNNIHIPLRIAHKDDIDTFIQFDDNKITMTAANQTIWVLDGGGPSILLFGNPDNFVNIGLTGGSIVSSTAGAVVGFDGLNGGQTWRAANSAAPPLYSWVTSRGTSNVPLTANTGDFVKRIRLLAWDGTTANVVADERFKLTGATYTSSNFAGEWEWRNTPEGSTTLTVAMVLNENQDLAVTNKISAGPTAPAAQAHIDQSSTTAAIPVLYLDQADISEEMIEFNTTIGTGNAIEVIGAKTLTTTHFIKVTIPGGLTRYFPVGTIA